MYHWSMCTLSGGNTLQFFLCSWGFHVIETVFTIIHIPNLQVHYDRNMKSLVISTIGICMVPADSKALGVPNHTEYQNLVGSFEFYFVILTEESLLLDLGVTLPVSAGPSLSSHRGLAIIYLCN